MLHSKCLKCEDKEADGVLTLSRTNKGEKVELYCKMCELEILYEMAVALDSFNSDSTKVLSVLEEKQTSLCNDNNTR